MTAIVGDEYGPRLRTSFGSTRPTRPRSKRTRSRARARRQRGPSTWHVMAGLPYPIRVAGFGLRRPKYRNPGRNLAGTVEAGGSVTRFNPGDAVFGIGDASFAEYARGRPDKLAPKPVARPGRCRPRLPRSPPSKRFAITDGSGRAEGADLRRVGRRGHLRRPDPQDVRSRGHRCMQHRKGGRGPSPRRRSRRRLHPRGLRRRQAPLRSDPPRRQSMTTRARSARCSRRISSAWLAARGDRAAR